MMSQFIAVGSYWSSKKTVENATPGVVGSNLMVQRFAWPKQIAGFLLTGNNEYNESAQRAAQNWQKFKWNVENMQWQANKENESI